MGCKMRNAPTRTVPTVSYRLDRTFITSPTRPGRIANTALAMRPKLAKADTRSDDTIVANSCPRAIAESRMPGSQSRATFADDLNAAKALARVSPTTPFIVSNVPTAMPAILAAYSSALPNSLVDACATDITAATGPKESDRPTTASIMASAGSAPSNIALSAGASICAVLRISTIALPTLCHRSTMDGGRLSFSAMPARTSPASPPVVRVSKAFLRSPTTPISPCTALTATLTPCASPCPMPVMAPLTVSLPRNCSRLLRFSFSASKMGAPIVRMACPTQS